MEACLVAEDSLFDGAFGSLDAVREQEVMDEDESEIPGRDFAFLFEQVRSLNDSGEHVLVCAQP